jgi:hypothetical protein
MLFLLQPPDGTIFVDTAASTFNGDVYPQTQPLLSLA